MAASRQSPTPGWRQILARVRWRAGHALRRDGSRPVDPNAPRILIAGPPKTGNMWIKCLLANAYGLRWIEGEDGPYGTNLEALRDFIARGGFAPGTIFHRHYPYSPDLVEIARGVPCHLVTMIRDPYDLFVSWYHHVQRMPVEDLNRQMARVVGKPIDDPAVFAYLETGFGANLQKGLEWIESGASIVVRYEDLHLNPLPTLTSVTDRIAPVPPTTIKTAFAACSPQRMRLISEGMAQHVRTATIGASRTALSPAHLAIFRDHHAPLIHSLGYPVR